MRKYELIDELWNEIEPDVLANYLIHNYPDYAISVMEAIQVEDMSRQYEDMEQQTIMDFDSPIGYMEKELDIDSLLDSTTK